MSKRVIVIDDAFLEEIRRNPSDFGERLYHALAKKDDGKMHSKYGVKAFSPIYSEDDKRFYILMGSEITEFNFSSPEMLELVKTKPNWCGYVISFMRNKADELERKLKALEEEQKHKRR